jgi:hypothetical protein
MFDAMDGSLPRTETKPVGEVSKRKGYRNRKERGKEKASDNNSRRRSKTARPNTDSAKPDRVPPKSEIEERRHDTSEQGEPVPTVSAKVSFEGWNPGFGLLGLPKGIHENVVKSHKETWSAIGDHVSSGGKVFVLVHPLMANDKFSQRVSKTMSRSDIWFKSKGKVLQLSNMPESVFTYGYVSKIKDVKVLKKAGYMVVPARVSKSYVDKAIKARKLNPELKREAIRELKTIESLIQLDVIPTSINVACKAFDVIATHDTSNIAVEAPAINSSDVENNTTVPHQDSSAAVVDSAGVGTGGQQINAVATED